MCGLPRRKVIVKAIYHIYNITVQQKSPPILIAFAECVFTQKPFYPNSFVCDLIRYPLFFMQVIKS